MSVRNGICPLIVSKGSDQMEITSQFEKRRDPSVISNFGKLLVELSRVVPDGMVCFFTRYTVLLRHLLACMCLTEFGTSYAYMEEIIAEWNRMGLLKQVREPASHMNLSLSLSQVLTHKLVFIETQDIVETSLALDAYKRACDCGRGAVFLSVARGFDRTACFPS